MLPAVPEGSRPRHGRVEIVVPGIVALFGIAAIAAAFLLDRQHRVPAPHGVRPDPAIQIEVQPEPALRDGARPEQPELSPEAAPAPQEAALAPAAESVPPHVERPLPQPSPAELEAARKAEEEERQARAREERQRALEETWRKAEEERQARALEEARQFELETKWRERFRSAYRKIEQLEAAEQQAQADADSIRLAVYNIKTGQRVPGNDSFAAAERLENAKRNLKKAREELDDLERQASYEAVPREWRH